MALIQAIDQVDVGLNRMLYQWKDSPNFNGLVESFLEQTQAVELSMQDLLTERSIFTSVGVQLDVLGALFGVDRAARIDDEYRDAILGSLAAQFADGSTEQVLELTRSVTNDSEATFFEHYPGNIHVYLQDGMTNSMYDVIYDMTAAGINMRLMFDKFGDGYVPSELNFQSWDLQTNNAEDIEVDTDGAGATADLQVQAMSGTSASEKAILPEINDVSNANPFADLVDRSALAISGSLEHENNDLIIDENGNVLTWQDYIFV